MVKVEMQLRIVSLAEGTYVLFSFAIFFPGAPLPEWPPNSSVFQNMHMHPWFLHVFLEVSKVRDLGTTVVPCYLIDKIKFLAHISTTDTNDDVSVSDHVGAATWVQYDHWKKGPYVFGVFF